MGGAGTQLTLYPTLSGDLSPTQSSPGSASFAGDPSGFEDPQSTGGVEFATATLIANTVLAGEPQLDLVASVTVERVHLIGTLYDESPEPEKVRRRISQFALAPSCATAWTR